jgi:hypothetical protein
VVARMHTASLEGTGAGSYDVEEAYGHIRAVFYYLYSSNNKETSVRPFYVSMFVVINLLFR